MKMSKEMVIESLGHPFSHFFCHIEACYNVSQCVYIQLLNYHWLCKRSIAQCIDIYLLIDATKTAHSLQILSAMISIHFLTILTPKCMVKHSLKHQSHKYTFPKLLFWM
jgi:hypothetical protein